MKELFSDTPTEKDLLGRDHFAKDIANNLIYALNKTSDSLVFGLNGRWGSGKSTLMKFIIANLQNETKNNEKVIIYDEFNPWMFSGQEQLQNEFLKGLKSKLQKSDKLKDFFKEKGEKLKKFLDFIPDEVLGSKTPYKESLGKCIDYLIEEKSVIDLKKLVDKLISENEIRLYIFIDDLDRLTPDEIIQIFQLIKLNANFKNTVFIVAYDAEVVQMALAKHYGDNGKRYLGKIIQVDYTIPEITIDELGDEFFNQLSKFITVHNIHYNSNDFIKIWENQRFKNYFTTLRDIYRYFNALLFRLPNIKDDVNVEQFLILEGARIFDFEGYQNIYTVIRENLNLYGGVSPLKNNDDDLSNFKNTTTLKLLKYIFNNSKVQIIQYTNESQKEIYDRMYLENYFSLKVTGNNILEKEFKDLMTIPDRRHSIIESIEKVGRIKSLLRRLSNSEIRKDYQIEEDLFKAILNVFNKDNSLLDELHYSLSDTLLNLALNFNNPKQGCQKLIDTIYNNKSHFEAGTYWMLHWFYYDIQNCDKIPQSQKIYIDVLLRNREKIEKRLQEMLSYWSFPFDYSSTQEYRFIKKIYIKDYARLFPNEYNEKLAKIFTYIEMEFPIVLLLLETMLIIPKVDEDFFRVDSDVKRLILPTQEYQIRFETILRELDIENYDEFTKKKISFYLSDLPLKTTDSIAGLENDVKKNDKLS